MPDLDLIKLGNRGLGTGVGGSPRAGRANPPASARLPLTVLASDSEGRKLRPGRLLTDAEVAEDYVEQVFDIDRASDAAEAAQRKTEVFRPQLG